MDFNYAKNSSRLLLLFLFLCLTNITDAASLPNGFAEARLASGLDPTAIELAPDGRLFITIKSGKVLIYKNNALLSTPLLNITVDNTNERGIQSIVLDPNFSSNGYFYVYYAVPGANHNRVSRFTAVGDVAQTSTELILIELDQLAGSVHNGGSMFFKDGKIFITTGEGSDANKAQSLTSLLGKVLRLNPNGTIPSDNPISTLGTTGKYQAIYAYGFRNPFRASIQPGTGRVFVNDVGNSTWEEVNDLLPGKNYGWPTIEGKRTTQTAPANYMDPVYAYSHSAGGCSITGGTFYNPTTGQFPAGYVGKYFFQDYCNNYIKVLDLSTYTVSETFATGLDRPIDIEVSSDGSLYYISRGGLGGGSQQDNTSSSEGEVWKVNYTGSGQPTIAAQPANTTVTVGGSTSFVVSASGNQPLTYQWQKNNVNISGATSSTYAISSAALADNGAVFRVIVTNGIGSATSNGAVLTVIDDKLPVPVISTPVAGAKFSGGQVLSFSGTASDQEDGDLPASAFTWEIKLYHDDHNHPAYPETTGSKSGTFTIPTSGETSSNIWYRVFLTVRDSKNQSVQIYRDVFPNKADITLATSPAGLSVKLDGTAVVTPYTFTGVTGIVRNIEAVSPQTLGSTTYQFTGWSDSGAITHNITTPSFNTTYTASFSSSLRTPENPSSTVSGVEYVYYENPNTTFWNAIPNFTTLTPTRSGNTTNFLLAAATPRADNFAYKYTGYINIPTAGSYSFYTNSDDGSRLYIGSTLVVDNDGAHSLLEKTGVIGLAAGKHAITVTYYEGGYDNVLTVSYQGPGITKQAIPASALFRSSGSVSLLLEAEDAVKSGVQNSTLHAGYTGTGFGDYINASADYIEWSANVPTAGVYTLKFRYGLISGDRPLEIKVNNAVLSSSLSFPGTTTWTNWSVVSITANLNAGINLIRATAIGSSGPNVDNLTVQSGSGGRLESSTVEISNSISFYPNPTTGIVRLTSGSNNKISGVHVINPQGKIILTKSVSGLIHDEIDLSQQPNDIYIFRIKHQRGVTTKKIVLAK